jgi:putative transposase
MKAGVAEKTFTQDGIVRFVEMIEGLRTEAQTLRISDLLNRTLEVSGLTDLYAVDVLEKAVARHGIPEIINSDQGVQYTCEDWHYACDKYGIRISMDGRARCLDNVWIERFWRTIKREYVYLNPEPTVGALRRGIAKYIDYYNNRRCHQGLAHRTPGAMYAAVAA